MEQQVESDRVKDQLRERQAHIQLLEQHGTQAAEEIEVSDCCLSLIIQLHVLITLIAFDISATT